MKISLIPFRFSNVLLCIFFSPAYVEAEESRLSLMAQNDVFVGSDGGGYTSGITLSHLRSVSPGQPSIAPLPVLGALAPWLGVGPATLPRFSLSQIMVTPRDITRKVPDPADAPYVGALWLGAGQVSVREEVADIVGFRIGVMGPASGARRTQTLIHSVIGSDRPEGWDTLCGPVRGPRVFARRDRQKPLCRQQYRRVASYAECRRRWRRLWISARVRVVLVAERQSFDHVDERAGALWFAHVHGALVS